jgi:D-serine deaminase-like pyridoxal phosphate-dependent protein
LSGCRATLVAVLIATLICSDEACAEEVDVVVDDLDSLETAICDCDCTFVVLSVSDWSPAELPVLV